jgi:membrane protein DedA with SNARE-associated domain
MQFILDSLLKSEGYAYLVMALVLGLCGLGLPVPEELTLLSSGILVGWNQANFWYACLACSSGILFGDSFMFWVGYKLKDKLLQNRFICMMISPQKVEQFSGFFRRHRNIALFIARFFPGVRIGVYAYAGSIGESFYRFFLLDCLGVLVSAPLSIWLGKMAALTFADTPEHAMHFAQQRAHDIGRFMLIGVIVLALVFVVVPMLMRRIWNRVERL